MTSVDADEQYAGNAGESFPSLRPPPGRLRSRVLNWREWPLATKLLALMAVPTLVVVVLGAVLVHSQNTEADAAARQEQLTKVTTQTRAVIAELTAMRSGHGHSGKHALTAETRALHDTVATAGLNGPATQRYDEARGQLRTIGDRTSSSGDKPSAKRYTSAITALLGFQSVLSKQFSAPELTPVAAALYRLDSARAEVSRQQALLHAAADGDGLTSAKQGRLRASQTRYTSDVQEFLGTSDRAAKYTYTAQARSGHLGERNALIRSVLEKTPRTSMIGVDEDTVSVDASTSKIDRLGKEATTAFDRTADQVARTLTGQGAKLADSASNRTGTTLVLLSVALLLSAAIAIVIVRQVLGSLRTLRAGAFDVAETELPDVVRKVRAGEQTGTGVAPIDINTREDVGQLAKAFDEVHGEAVRLAVEQARLRAEYGSIFVNLSRRSQSLVQRQLRLVERLERDEEDPDQLDTLFQLDHLATRMRRNNENLIVLSGGELGRGPGQPLPMADLLRAAVSEVEQYQRIAVGSPEQVDVVGYAASDLVRLIAELLDNATSYSAPSTGVQLSCEFAGDDLRVVIADDGVGMSASELESANRQLRATDAEAMPTARRMGLFVVGRLAAQYDVTVRLEHRSGGRGLQAELVLPGRLFSRNELPESELPESEQPAQRVEPELPLPREASRPQSAPRHRQQPQAPQQPTPQSQAPQQSTPRPPMPPSQAQDEVDDLFAPGANLQEPPAPTRPPPQRNGSDPQRNGSDQQRNGSDQQRNGSDQQRNGSDQQRNGSAAGDRNGSGPQSPLDRSTVRDTPPASDPGAEESRSGRAGAEFFEPDATTTAPEAQPPSPAGPGRDSGLVDETAAARWTVRRTFNGGVPYRLVGPTAISPAELDGMAEAGRRAAEQRPSFAGPEDLFAAQRPVQPDTTPIFDEMASAWFVDADGGKADPPMVWPDNTSVVGDPTTTPGAWSPSDSGWREADDVARAAPSEFTEVGLPMRTPKANLVRGRMGRWEQLQEQPSAQPERDANAVWQRYSSFHRGVDEGRDTVHGEPLGEQSSEAVEDQAGSGEQLGQASQQPRTEQPTAPRPQPQRPAPPQPQPEPPRSEQPEVQQPEVQQQIADAAELPPLPRRVPGKGLAHRTGGGQPGQPEQAEPSGAEGGHSLFDADPAAPAPEPGPQGPPQQGPPQQGPPQQGPPQQGPPQQGPPQQGPPQQGRLPHEQQHHEQQPQEAGPPEPAGSTEPAAPPEPAEPSELTSMGLPKRTRGAQLIPREDSSTETVRRDSEEVRSSLSGLQRGVTRGWQEREKTHAQRGTDSRGENE